MVITRDASADPSTYCDADFGLLGKTKQILRYIFWGCNVDRLEYFQLADTGLALSAAWLATFGYFV